MRKKLIAVIVALATAPFVPQSHAAGPDHVDITWMSIANIHYQMGSFGVLTDGYVTRLPESDFHGCGRGYAYTKKPPKPDVAAGSGDGRPEGRRGGGFSERRRQSRLSIHGGGAARPLQLVLPEFGQRCGPGRADRHRRRGLWRADRKSQKGDARRRTGIGGFMDWHRRPAGRATGCAGHQTHGPYPDPLGWTLGTLRGRHAVALRGCGGRRLPGEVGGETAQARAIYGYVAPRQIRHPSGRQQRGQRPAGLNRHSVVPALA